MKGTDLEAAVELLDRAEEVVAARLLAIYDLLDPRVGRLQEAGTPLKPIVAALHYELKPRLQDETAVVTERIRYALDREREWLYRIIDREVSAEAYGPGSNPVTPVLGDPSGDPSGGPRLPRVSGVEPDGLTAQFAEYGDASVDATRWTGADSAYSVALPDGRVLWVFSDTFVGPVDQGRRSPEVDNEKQFMPCNTLVVQDGTQFTTIVGSDPDGSGPSIGPAVSAVDAVGELDGYWAGDAQVCDDTVEIMYRRFDDAQFLGLSAVARFHQAFLNQPMDVVELPFASPVQWGSAVRRAEGYTYVYGSEDLPDGKFLHIARVEGDSLIGTWEFYTGAGWSTDHTASARQLTGVANEFSVSPVNGGYLLLTHDTTTPLSPDIVGYVGATPFGPFEQKTLLYRTPETGVSGSFGSPRVYTHNAHAHPHIDRGSDGLLVSYNVHAWPAAGEEDGANGPELSRTDIYRPRFVTVRFDL